MTELLPNLEVTVSFQEVRRLLGYRKGRSPSDRVARRLGELWSTAEAMLHPRGAFRQVDGRDAGSCGMPDPVERVALGLCTIGGELEEEASRRSGAGQMLDALLLDAFGSAAAESAAEALNLEICRAAAGQGLFLDHRISPGYGSWDVANQKELLELLPAERLGVRLTPGMMMVPRKSVSFAVGYLSRPVRDRRAADRCERCGLRGCASRRTGAEGEA